MAVPSPTAEWTRNRPLTQTDPSDLDSGILLTGQCLRPGRTGSVVLLSEGA